MDTNGDGKLSQGEIARALRRQEYAVDQNLVENMIWEVDEDHDGHVGREEFLRAYERCSNDPTASEPRQLYNVVLFFLHASRPPGSNNQDVLRMTGEDASRLVYLHHGRVRFLFTPLYPHQPWLTPTLTLNCTGRNGGGNGGHIR